MGDLMNTEQRDELRERNRRRASACPKCGSQAIRELTAKEIDTRDDTLPGLKYRTCGACGQTWRWGK